MRLPDLSPLVGATVARICFDYQVTVLFVRYAGDGVEEVSATLVVGTSFVVEAGETAVTVFPATGGGYAAVLGLLHSTVTSVAVAADQALTLVLSGGDTLRVPRHPRYESWELNGEGMDSWLVGPG